MIDIKDITYKHKIKYSHKLQINTRTTQKNYQIQKNTLKLNYFF
jgi:hypothetical protein